MVIIATPGNTIPTPPDPIPIDPDPEPTNPDTRVNLQNRSTHHPRRNSNDVTLTVVPWSPGSVPRTPKIGQLDGLTRFVKVAAPALA